MKYKNGWVFKFQIQKVEKRTKSEVYILKLRNMKT